MNPRLCGRWCTGTFHAHDASHGNDPTSGSSRHTREFVPLLAFSPAFASVDLGIRPTLADVGATVADLFDLFDLDSGTSFAKEILCSST